MEVKYKPKLDKRTDQDKKLIAYEIRNLKMDIMKPNPYVHDALEIYERQMRDLYGEQFSDREHLCLYTQLTVPKTKNKDHLVAITYCVAFLFMLDDFCEKSLDPEECVK